MGEHQGPLLWRHLVLLCLELVDQLFPHRLEDGLQEGAPEYQRSVCRIKKFEDLDIV